MNAKYLWLKFLFVLAVVLVCVWSLLRGGGLKQGIDLKGGHSLTFEIRTYAADIANLKTDREKVEQELQTAADDKARAELQSRIERINAEIKRLEGEESTGASIVPQVIGVLKDRIDPNGLRNLEWKPVGRDRFEVRMPAAGEDSKLRRRAYEEARKNLEEGNLQRGELARLVATTDPEERAKQIAALSGADERLRKGLETLLAAHAEMQAAEKRLKDAKTKEQIDAATADFENKRVAYGGQMREALSHNVNIPALQEILGLYVSDAEAAGLKSDEVKTRRALFTERLAQFLARYPARSAQIQKAVDLYQDWAKVRQWLEDPVDLKRMIAKAGVLEFRIAPYLPGIGRDFTIERGEYEAAVKSLQEDGPEGLRKRNAKLLWFPIREGEEKFSNLITAKGPDGRMYLLLYNEPDKAMLHETGPGSWALKDARPDIDRMGRQAIGFSLNAAGAQIFSRLTGAHIDHAMAILLDDEVYSAPSIESAIGSSGIITGTFTEEQVDEMVRTLRAGSLPARVNPEPVAERTFGPTLGAINRDMGIRAAYWGLIAVAVFMLFYYLLCGAIADVALLLNIILILGGMSLMSAVFTLPGIAGVILTIGIAVDANVLIFERLREEQARGQSVRMALKNAYERAFSAILDANVTTLVTCFILGWVGTEEVRGFAITLSLGVVFSMFTALVVTRWVFQVLLDARMVVNPLHMLRIIGTPTVNWTKYRYAFWTMSAAFMVLGVASLFWQKSAIWGIEFSSGTQAVVTLRDGQMLRDPQTGKMELPTDDLVRRMFLDKAREMNKTRGDLQMLLDTARVEKLINPFQARDLLRKYDRNEDGKISRDEWKQAGLGEEFFARADRDGDGLLDRGEMDADRWPTVSYQITTTETKLQKIRDVSATAFGAALDIRPDCKYALAKGASFRSLGVDFDDRGYEKISAQVVENADPSYREQLRDYQGGVLFVVRDIAPPLTARSMRERIGDMRLQPDFQGQNNQTEVLPLTAAEADAFSAFAVLVRSEDAAVAESDDAWDAFAAKEVQLVEASLERGESIVATVFDAAIAGKAAQQALVAVVLSWLAIIAYLWFRFGSAQWGLAAVLCLIHDTIVVVGLVAASGWLHEHLGFLGIQSFKIDLAMV
ncbi:MAG TPA: protein translocase subunit SecD, partial [Phycisphaerae bacterium]|nr:protein translocase subunit SecD [Phycisphaerae bacterium]